MKKRTYIILLFTILCLFPIVPVHAQTASTSAGKPPVKVDDLMDRLATRVAQLSQTQKKAITGTVNSVSVSSFTLETATKNYKIELPDTLKVIQMIKGKRTELTQEDIAKGDIVTAFGGYDETIDTLRASVVWIEPAKPLFKLTGIVDSVDKTDYSFTVKTPEKQTITVDFETSSKLSIFNGVDITKGGFSKITPKSSIIITGTAVPNKANRYSATRILILQPDTPTNTPKAPIASPSSTTKE